MIVVVTDIIIKIVDFVDVFVGISYVDLMLVLSFDIGCFCCRFMFNS